MGGVYSIPAERPFAPALARGLLDAHGAEGLADVTLLLPSRRACLVLRDAFLALADATPLLLPRLLPVGDAAGEIGLLDPALARDVPPELDDLRRRLLLFELVRAQDADLPDEQAFRLADDLAVLVDELAVEDVDLAALETLDFSAAAEHAQTVGRFLSLMAALWPGLVAAEGAIGRIERRRRLLEATAQRWAASTPGPVVLAGVTGSVKAVAELAVTVAALPGGQVVLPGLDPDLDETAWAGLPPSHPQWGFARLLAMLGVSAAEVQPWPATAGAVAVDRRRLLARMANPAGWPALPLDPPAALAGVALLEAPDLATEALAIALELRCHLDDPAAQAVVVTPDRQLARRIAAELQRFGVAIEDSAGQPLDQTAPGNFLLLAAHAWLDPDPVVPLLALVKHPLARGGADAGFCRRAARVLERELRLGASDASGWRALDAAATAVGGAVAAWYARLRTAGQALAELADRGEATPRDLLTAHLALMDGLARDDAGSDAEWWAGVAGRELERFLASLETALEGIGTVAATAYPPMLATAMAATAVRRPHAAHPQIEILGRFEARLAGADLVILAGLNEGVWPAPPEPGPWLGRRQRAELGLPPVEQHVGYAAHDFVQLAASAPALRLSRSRRDAGGAPTAPSRWLSQLHRSLARLGAVDALPTSPAVAWAEAFDRPPGPAQPRPRPQPRPPATARPQRLSVSDIERLIHNPYAVYAERVLGLAPLPALVRPIDVADRGTLIHAILEAFVRAHPATLPADAEARLLALGHAHFDRGRLGDAVVALWWPRFCRLAGWFVDLERERRSRGLRVLAECSGTLAIDLGRGRSVLLRGRIDRLERHSGAATIVDYKTGTAPRDGEVLQGLKPQLPLLGAIVRGGELKDLSPIEVTELCYLELKGAEPPGTLRTVAAGATDEVIAATLRGVEKMLRDYAKSKVPYVPIPRPLASAYPDPFAPLSRDQEWLDEATSP